MGGEEQRKPGVLICHVACSLGFYDDGISFWVVFTDHSDSESFLVVHQHSAKMDASQKDSWRWSDPWCLFLTFPKLFQLVVAY